MISVITEINEMHLNETDKSFISHCGTMGSLWGFNKTIGKVYALLFISEHPLCAEQMTGILHISRSNVCMSLKELQSWRLLICEHRPGDRRDYFSTLPDVWQILRTIAYERKRREIDPTLSHLRNLLLNNDSTYAQGRMQQMHDLIETLSDSYNELDQLNQKDLLRLIGLGRKVSYFFNRKKKQS